MSLMEKGDKLYKISDDIKLNEVINFFPTSLKECISFNLITPLEEIRIRAGKPVILKNDKYEKVLEYVVTLEEILQILQKICNNSIYSYQSQICNGFITLKGGHRVGIVGNAVMNEKEVSNLNYINSLNFRISRQVFNCSNLALPYVLNTNINNIYNTLIISPPRAWKNHTS